MANLPMNQNPITLRLIKVSNDEIDNEKFLLKLDQIDIQQRPQGFAIQLNDKYIDINHGDRILFGNVLLEFQLINDAAHHQEIAHPFDELWHEDAIIDQAIKMNPVSTSTPTRLQDPLNFLYDLSQSDELIPYSAHELLTEHGATEDSTWPICKQRLLK